MRILRTTLLIIFWISLCLMIISVIWDNITPGYESAFSIIGIIGASSFITFLVSAVFYIQVDKHIKNQKT